MTDADKLKVLEAILLDMQGREACYPDAELADEIVERYRKATGDYDFAAQSN